jgi:hypothetical protein
MLFNYKLFIINVFKSLLLLKLSFSFLIYSQLCNFHKLFFLLSYLRNILRQMLWIFSSSSDRVSGGQDLTLNFLKCGIVFDFLKNNKDITCTCSTLTVEWGIKRKGKESCAADVCYPDDMNKELCSKQIAKGLFIHIFKLHSILKYYTDSSFRQMFLYRRPEAFVCMN